MHPTRGAYGRMQVTALQDEFQARDGKNRFGDLDMPGDFMHYCANALKS
jgi:seryl-tRNA synthetase